MNIKFNVEKLEEILYDFYLLTGMTVSFWDTENNQLAYQPKNSLRFCTMIQESEEGRRRCLASNKELFARCLEDKKPHWHRCHAGLTDIAVPVMYENILLGYIIFGQISFSSDAETHGFDAIRQSCKDLPVDPAELETAFLQLKNPPPACVDAATHLLEMVTCYLWLSDTISYEKNILANRLRSEIETHIHEKITIPMLCEALGCSPKRLYAVANDFFGIPVHRYILEQKVKFACKQLLAGDDPVYIVSAAVGISDYNYFTKVFTRVTGLTPSGYRKKYRNDPSGASSDES